MCLPRAGWTATADSQETAGENGVAGNVLDGDVGTLWHSKWSGTADPLPHVVTIDMKVPTTVSALRYLPRPGGGNGTIGQYRVEVSLDGAAWGSPVATGVWPDNGAEKTASFGSVSARFVRLTALSEAGNRGPWTSVAEVNVLGSATTTTDSAADDHRAPRRRPRRCRRRPRRLRRRPRPPPATGVLPRTGGRRRRTARRRSGRTVSAGNVLDGDVGTLWHSKWSGTADPLPHVVTIDMKAPMTVSALRYLPRPGGGNGTIGQYRVEVSLDGAAWGSPVATGVWPTTGRRRRRVLGRCRRVSCG